MSAPTLYILIGNIASGKSTFSHKLAQQGVVVANDDSFVTGVHGGNYQLYRQQFKPLYKAIELATISTALGHGYDVIVDRTNMSRRMRRRYIGLGHSYDAHVMGVKFPLVDPEVHARRRFEHDNRGYSEDYWLEVAERIHRSWEPPTLDEGFDNLVSPDVALQMALES